MRKFQKQQIEEIIQSLHEMHRQIKRKLEQKDIEVAGQALNECQMAAIQVGETIEQIEGEGTETVGYLEQYCERVYQVNTQMQEIPGQKAFKCLEEMLIKAENAIHNIPGRTEVVFLPYKVSMWDSLESVWMAAEADPDCDAYVIPIPYYDKNSDGSFKEEHYEGSLYPDYVPVVHYNDYDFAKHRPDAIFIHNPYDQYNNVTSVHPFFYSKNLKKFTNKLVYIPYYATAGGMSEAQSTLPSYYYVDYIVIQAEKYRKYFDANLPEEKFLPLGSPKFDKVIRTCKNPPEPPASWKDKMAGKKVYFYNTSINGMLANTANFLKKMEYVFQCFANRNDVCLVWRPHPLLESTFESMRASYKPIYDALKKYYLESDFGIYDDTPEITDTIALCDAYIGDAGTSVTSLFGVVGKPLFILNNNIHTLPEEEDWKGEIIKGIYDDGQNQWYVTQGNKLYYSENNDFHYKYFCDLSEYSAGSYYQRAIEYKDKVYICPINAQDILVVLKDKSIKKIELEQLTEQQGAFSTSIWVGEYIFIFPNKYPATVRFNMRTQEINYITVANDIYINDVNGERRFGGICIWNNNLLVGSPDGSKILKIESNSLMTEVFELNAKGGISGIKMNGEDIWTVPYEGSIVTCWDFVSNEKIEYDAKIDGLQCVHKLFGYECDIKLFCEPIFCENQVILSPNWGNKFVCIDKRSRRPTEWKFPIMLESENGNGYFPSWGMGYFVYNVESTIYRFYDNSNRKLYDIDVKSKRYKEVEMVFDKEELRKHEPGFAETSGWMQYCCKENSFNSLKDFLDGNITGKPFDIEKQLMDFSKINASINGDCGEKVYRDVMENI